MNVIRVLGAKLCIPSKEPDNQKCNCYRTQFPLLTFLMGAWSHKPCFSERTLKCQCHFDHFSKPQLSTSPMSFKTIWKNWWCTYTSIIFALIGLARFHKDIKSLSQSALFIDKYFSTVNHSFSVAHTSRLLLDMFYCPNWVFSSYFSPEL